MEPANPTKLADRSRAPGPGRVRSLRTALAAPVRRLLDPGLWPVRRAVGEVLLALVLAVSTAGIESLGDGGPVRSAAVGLAAGLLSPLRRVLPLTVLLAAVVCSAPLDGLAPLVPVAAWSAGRRSTGPGRAVGTFTSAVALGLGLDAFKDSPGLSLSSMVFFTMWLLITIVVPGIVGGYWYQRDALADLLEQYRVQILRERAMVAEQARLRERQRIAQDMHDSLGHQLALISVHTGALEVDRELTGRRRETVAVLREASVTAMHELREVVGLLREGTEPADGAGPGAPAAVSRTRRGVAGVEGLAEASRAAGAAVTLRHTGERRPLPPAADHTAYRVVQEGLTNAHKHAPGAPVAIELRYEPDSLVVEVANGPGPVPAGGGRPEVVSGGQGLTGLGERARLVGGMIHTGPRPDGGFRLAGVLPYTVSESDPAGPSPLREARETRRSPTTFVGPAGDFGEQTRAGSSGEGDPVIDWNDLPKELSKAMSKRSKGCGIAALIILVLVIAAGVGGYFLLKEGDKAMIEPKKYDAIKVGSTEEEVRKQLPQGDTFLTKGLDEGAPPIPAGASCLSLTSTEMGSSWDKSPVFRFCFKDGRLIEKKSFEVKS